MVTLHPVLPWTFPGSTKPIQSSCQLIQVTRTMVMYGSRVMVRAGSTIAMVRSRLGLWLGLQLGQELWLEHLVLEL